MANQLLDHSARSNWASLAGIKVARVAPMSQPASGIVAVPGSKSITNRAIILAAAAEGSTRLKGILRSDDSYWCIQALRQLGVSIEEHEDVVSLTGVAAWQQPEKAVFIGSAGTTARFLTSLLAVTTTVPVEMTASAQMSGRPMKTLLDALTKLGGQFRFQGKEGYFPFTIDPATEGVSSIELSGSTSSQFLSGLLMASPRVGRPIEVTIPDHVVQADYVRITLDLMQHFGVTVESAEDMRHFVVQPAAYRAKDLTIESDASTASYFLAIAAVTGGEVTIPNLNLKSLQPDIRFVEILEQMGCTVTKNDEGVTLRGPKKLRGGFTINMRACSDVVPTLAAIAPFADGPIEITDVEHIRSHESDRLKVMATTLAELGVPVEERRDGLRITPAQPRFGVVATHDDHRIAMSFAVLGAAGSGIGLEDPGSVSKTCPGFFNQIAGMGVGVTLEP
ncbi:MAG TPA: 3-phosphoshikimate 1-carboxyvinyltransferase [Granulicella sp.]